MDGYPPGKPGLHQNEAMRGSPYELQLKLVGWPLCKRPLRILEVFRIVRARADALDFQQLDSLGCCVAPLLYLPPKKYDPNRLSLRSRFHFFLHLSDQGG